MKKFDEQLWTDKDLLKFVAIAVLIGVAVGFVWGWSAGSPDLSKQPVTYLRG